MTHEQASGAAATSTPRTIRFAIATAAVALWVAAGWLLRLDANGYLLVGVPLTVAFQRLVARRPLHALWVRDAERFHLGRVGAAIALALAIAPAVALVRTLRAPDIRLASVGWGLCALAGAVAAGFAFRALRRDSLRALLACLVVAGGIGALFMVASWRARGAPVPPGLGRGLWSLVLYLPVTFVLEEVFFRGALDAWVHRPGERWGLGSAAFVSVLWALWHLPVVPRIGPAEIVGLLLVHVSTGIPLSLYWRRGGNLAAPALAHAAIDAVRNALLAQGAPT